MHCTKTEDYLCHAIRLLPRSAVLMWKISFCAVVSAIEVLLLFAIADVHSGKTSHYNGTYKAVTTLLPNLDASVVAHSGGCRMVHLFGCAILWCRVDPSSLQFLLRTASA